jgi:hypothetical protein
MVSVYAIAVEIIMLTPTDDIFEDRERERKKGIRLGIWPPASAVQMNTRIVASSQRACLELTTPVDLPMVYDPAEILACIRTEKPLYDALEFSDSLRLLEIEKGSRSETVRAHLHTTQLSTSAQLFPGSTRRCLTFGDLLS